MVVIGTRLWDATDVKKYYSKFDVAVVVQLAGTGNVLPLMPGLSHSAEDRLDVYAPRFK